MVETISFLLGYLAITIVLCAAGLACVIGIMRLLWLASRAVWSAWEFSRGEVERLECEEQSDTLQLR